MCCPRVSRYDGYYDDVIPPDTDRVKEGLDKELVKKIVALSVGVIFIISMCVVGESYLRKGVKNRTVPGFYVAGEGSKFMVNVPLLLKQLDMQSKSNVSENISEE